MLAQTQTRAGVAGVGHLFLQHVEPCVHAGERQLHGVGNVDLVQPVDADAVLLDDLGRDAHGGAVGRNLCQHDGARRDVGIVADLERAQHLGARADQHVVAQRGVAFAVVLAGTAQRHALIQDAVVADDRRFADDDAGAVVDEKPPPDLRPGVDFNIGLSDAALRDPPRQEKQVVHIAPVGAAIHAHGAKARVQKHDLQRAAGRGVAVLDALNVFFPSGKQRKNLLKNNTPRCKGNRGVETRFHSDFSLGGTWPRP